MCPLSGRLNRASGCAAFNSGRDMGPLIMMEMFIYVRCDFWAVGQDCNRWTITVDGWKQGCGS